MVDEEQKMERKEKGQLLDKKKERFVEGDVEVIEEVKRWEEVEREDKG